MKTMVVRKACRYWLIPHSQCKARGRMERIIISMLSAIQQRPTTKLSTIWNLPKPMLLMAWVTVKVSSGTTPLAAAIKRYCFTGFTNFGASPAKQVNCSNLLASPFIQPS